METLNLNELTGNLLDETTVFAAGKSMQGTAALITTVVVGLLICFFGLKLVKILTTIIGAVMGACIGVTAAIRLGFTNPVFLIVVLACALILGALAFFLYKFGIFIMVLCYVFGICAVVIQPESLIPLIVCIVIPIIVAVLAIIYIEPLVIIVTALSGGISAGSAIAALITTAGQTTNMWIGIGIGAVLAIIGMVIQFMLHSRKIGKTERVHAKKVREEVSRESEVEKARMILDDEIEEKEDEDE